jgi:hypothetical protein
MQRRKGREGKTKSRFPEQAPFAVYAFVLRENALIFGVKGVLAVSNV